MSEYACYVRVHVPTKKIVSISPTIPNELSNYYVKGFTVLDYNTDHYVVTNTPLTTVGIDVNRFSDEEVLAYDAKVKAEKEAKALEIRLERGISKRTTIEDMFFSLYTTPKEDETYEFHSRLSIETHALSSVINDKTTRAKQIVDLFVTFWEEKEEELLVADNEMFSMSIQESIETYVNASDVLPYAYVEEVVEEPNEEV